VRVVFEHEREHPSSWAAITSIATRPGITPETLRKWIRRAGTDQGLRPGLTSTERERLKASEHSTEAAAVHLKFTGRLIVRQD